ncbi:MAG: single-stranded DNA-binding protein [Actinomycetaceae bacterium]|nr:single-stranded DNA-binding protein [Actinomycetaceae bacterium]
MFNATQVTIRGYVGGVPKIFDASGVDVMCIVSVGVTARSFHPREKVYKDSETVWYSVRCYGELAKNVHACVSKGMPLIVRGRLEQRSWKTREGENRSSMVLIADSVGVDMNHGIVQYMKNRGHREIAEEKKKENEKGEVKNLAPDAELVFA